MRLETCLYISCIGLSGYLLFNPVGFVMVPLFLSILFATGASYGYNHITDKKEDRINNRRLNVFVSKMGTRVAASPLLLGIALSLFLPAPSFLAFILSMSLGAAYSKFRIKEIFLAKNFYTGFTIGLMFLAGSLAGGLFAEGIAAAFLVAFFFGFMLNLLGDIRGYEGDLSAGVRTLPVAIGIHPSERFAHFMFMGLSSSILIFRLNSFYPLALFPLLISFSVVLERHKAARYLIISSFIVFSGFLYISRTLGA